MLECAIRLSGARGAGHEGSGVRASLLRARERLNARECGGVAPAVARATREAAAPRFVQLSLDLSTIRWSWGDYLLMHELEAVGGQKDSLTVVLHCGGYLPRPPSLPLPALSTPIHTHPHPSTTPRQTYPTPKATPPAPKPYCPSPSP